MLTLIKVQSSARVLTPAAMVITMTALACAVLTGCGSGGEDERPPTPIAWVTPPVPDTTAGLTEFSPECDAEMIRVARGEAALEQTLPSCATMWEWMGAANRYPAALPAGEEAQSVLSVLVDLCFRAPDELFLKSGACLQTVGGPTGPLAIYGGEWNGDDALLVGTLSRQGPCLYIVDPVGYSPAPAGKPLLLAFGIGAGWDAKSETVTYAGRELRVGEVVQVGGSAVRKSAVSTRWLVPPAPECESDLIWFVGEPSPAVGR